jgi:hypothetical protein
MTPNLRRYLENNVRNWIGLPAVSAHACPEMPTHLQELFLRTEERVNPQRDQWGLWEHTFSQNYREGKLWIPEVSLWVREQIDRLRRLGVALEPSWPGNHRFAVCLTHDVDDMTAQRHWQRVFRRWKILRASEYPSVATHEKVLRFLGSLFPLRQHRFASVSTKETMDRVLEIEEKWNVSSSFLFTIYPLTRYSEFDCDYSLRDTFVVRGRRMTGEEMVRKLLDEGHDVGLHGSFFSAFDESVLAEQKGRLEQITGRPVETTRQHWLNWDPMGTPAIQVRSGLRADSTLGFNRNIGYRAGTVHPFTLYDWRNDVELPLLEAPLILHDGALFRRDALEYSVEMAEVTCRQFVETAESLGGCLTMVFHPNAFIDPRYGVVYEAILRYSREKGAWITSLRDLSGWWIDRSRRILGKAESVA